MVRQTDVDRTQMLISFIRYVNTCCLTVKWTLYILFVQDTIATVTWLTCMFVCFGFFFFSGVA